jgi:hypothetical protein
MEKHGAAMFKSNPELDSEEVYSSKPDSDATGAGESLSKSLPGEPASPVSGALAFGDALSGDKTPPVQRHPSTDWEVAKETENSPVITPPSKASAADTPSEEKRVGPAAATPNQDAEANTG